MEISFKNLELDIEVRTRVNNKGEIEVNAEDTAKGFGWTVKQKVNGKEYTKVRWSRINEHCRSFGFVPEVVQGDYIPEWLFYMLGMKANNETARKFQLWLAKEVIPSIREEQYYVDDNISQDNLDKLEKELKKYKKRYGHCVDIIAQATGCTKDDYFTLEETAEEFSINTNEEVDVELLEEIIDKKWKNKKGEFKKKVLENAKVIKSIKGTIMYSIRARELLFDHYCKYKNQEAKKLIGSTKSKEEAF